MDRDEIIGLVERIYDSYYSEESTEVLKILQGKIEFSDVESLFQGDYSAEYIYSRILSYKKTRIGDLSIQELIELVEKIIACEGKEYEIDNMLTMLEESVADPNISDYIYWSEKEMIPTEIVDKALSYKPIQL